jgi:hypothetical protein
MTPRIEDINFGLAIFAVTVFLIPITNQWKEGKRPQPWRMPRTFFGNRVV